MIHFLTTFEFGSVRRLFSRDVCVCVCVLFI